MVKRYRTVGARLEEKKYYDYIAALGKRGSNPNEDLTKRIDEVLKIEQPGTNRETPTRDQQQNNEVRGKAERTITVNGKTYTLT